jgi:hypothetical protein
MRLAGDVLLEELPESQGAALNGVLRRAAPAVDALVVADAPCHDE